MRIVGAQRCVDAWPEERKMGDCRLMQMATVIIIALEISAVETVLITKRESSLIAQDVLVVSIYITIPL